MDLQLNDGLTPGKSVHITRSFPGEPRHSGFLMGVGESLTLLLQFHDFSPEGYTVLRNEDILETCSGKRESYRELILRSEGIINHVDTSLNVPLNDMRSFLETLRGQYLIVECESQDPDDDEFSIGRITSLGKDMVSLETFNSLGVWDELPDDIPYDAITKLQFDTPYINIITKYLSYPERETQQGRISDYPAADC